MEEARQKNKGVCSRRGSGRRGGRGSGRGGRGRARSGVVASRGGRGRGLRSVLADMDVAVGPALESTHDEDHDDHSGSTTTMVHVHRQAVTNTLRAAVVSQAVAESTNTAVTMSMLHGSHRF